MSNQTLGLESSVRFLSGVGPRRAKTLKKNGIITVGDLLFALPKRYENRREVTTISKLSVNATTGIRGKVLGTGVRSTRRPGFKLFEMLVGDETGQIYAIFPNQTYLNEVFKDARTLLMFGTVSKRNAGGLQLTNPEYELVQNDGATQKRSIHIGRTVPVYEKLETFSSKLRRRVVYETLERLGDNVDEVLPKAVRQEWNCLRRKEALTEAHFPQDDTSLETLNRFQSQAQKDLIFEEFFDFQLGLQLNRRSHSKLTKAGSLVVTDRIRGVALNVLPFHLTTDQKRVLREVVDDLTKPTPMNRLLQGDVGSGKTIVALLAAVVAIENGFQVAFMAPTELLSEQHEVTLRKALAHTDYSIELLTGSMKSADRDATAARIRNGSSQLIIGTHALIQTTTEFRSLGLIIIDEQHRFGVAQRASLRKKNSKANLLLMTATPIPRTLALSAYGDLDVSEIRERPPGRRNIVTKIASGSARKEVFRFVDGQISQGRQAFVVYPLIEESAKLDLKAATVMVKEIEEVYFKNRRVALIHGRLHRSERERLMNEFSVGEIDLLVATTVIEVGLDVPNASVMVIEQAERFGLAQLHQLRGRVGRGEHESFCILLHKDNPTATSTARLKALVDTNDGFMIAERDLQLRGPGDFFGTRQSGTPLFRTGDVVRDYGIMNVAARIAKEWLAGPEQQSIDLNRVKLDWSTRFPFASTS